MRDEALRVSAELLAGGQAHGVLGLRATPAGVAPYVFGAPDKLDELVLEPKWPLAKLGMQLLEGLPADYRLAVICRGCDERALIELVKRHQLDEGRLVRIGMACSAEQARACLCPRPYPQEIMIGTMVDGVDPFSDERVRRWMDADAEARLQLWRNEFARCIKCYGCRNACPICVCVPCKLEDDLWVRRGEIPADMISYHLIRAFHLSDTCVACGACQDACPVDIPLLHLQLVMRRHLQEAYGYEAGIERERPSPVLADLRQEPLPGCREPAWIDSMGEKHET